MFYLLAALAGTIAYVVSRRFGRRTRIIIALAVFLVPSVTVTAWVIGVGNKTPPNSLTIDTGGLPRWVAALIKEQPQPSRTEIDQVVYHGNRAFLVMPGDRAFDSGNEHVLRSEDGHTICEFGGFAGHVTVGSCDMDDIKFVRTLFRRPSH